VRTERGVHHDEAADVRTGSRGCADTHASAHTVPNQDRGLAAVRDSGGHRQDLLPPYLEPVPRSPAAIAVAR
jgi:hypothetical protein